MTEQEIKFKIAIEIAGRQLTKKGINDATDAIYDILKQALSIGGVSQQRELLKDFLQYVNCSNTDSKVSFDLLDKYLNSL